VDLSRISQIVFVLEFLWTISTACGPCWPSAHGRPGQGTAGELAGAHSTRCYGSPKFTVGWSEVRVRVGEVVPGVIGA
jgi:hypothetical protein